MARKHSDLAMLLTRGREAARGRSHWWSTFRRNWLGRLGLGGWFAQGGSRRSDSRGNGAGGLVLAAVLLVGFTAGYLTAGAVGTRHAGGGASVGGGAGAPGPLKMGPIGELDTKVLSNEALLVAAYEGLQPEDAKQRARRLVDYLAAQGFATARPYEFRKDGQSLWNVVVYVKGPSDAKSQRQRLLALPGDLPDEFATRWRQEPEMEPGNSWPFRIQIQ